MEYVISEFKPMGGKHCITNALKQMFEYYQIPMTEAMLFGMGTALGFAYVNLAHSPMISGRSKPIEFEQKLAERLQIEINCRQPKNAATGFAKAKKLLQQNQPVMVYVDMPYMKYLGMNSASHFGGHAVVLFGYDDERQIFYVSDRDHSNFPIRTPKGTIANDYHLVSYQEMENARSSNFRPFPANNKYLTFDFSSYKAPTAETITAAINETCETMLRTPAKLLGIDGITKFSREIIKWRTFEQRKLKTAGITNYFQISKDGGTGGGIFRKMYGEFLLEAEPILSKEELGEIGRQFINIAEAWDQLAELFWQLGSTGNQELLRSMSVEIARLGDLERIALERLQIVINA